VAWSVASQIAKSDSEKISVLGAGETGELVIRYLRKLCPGLRINLVNRDVSKLYLVANKYDVLPFPLTGLHEALIDSHALVVTTNSAQPLVHAEHVAGSALKTIYDLSVPRNVAGRVYQIINVRDVDDISAGINQTIENRLREIPRVEQIIAHHIEEFKNWSYRRQLYSINQ
jgi:glutamyl-tRNA reductase